MLNVRFSGACTGLIKNRIVFEDVDPKTDSRLTVEVPLPPTCRELDPYPDHSDGALRRILAKLRDQRQPHMLTQ